MTDRSTDETVHLHAHGPLCSAPRVKPRAGTQIKGVAFIALLIGFAFAALPGDAQHGAGRSAWANHGGAVLLAQTVRSSPDAGATTRGDSEGADCFYASNRDHPLCSEAPRTAPATVRSTAPSEQGESVDCFYAENRDNPMCRDLTSRRAPRSDDQLEAVIALHDRVDDRLVLPAARSAAGPLQAWHC